MCQECLFMERDYWLSLELSRFRSPPNNYIFDSKYSHSIFARPLDENMNETLPEEAA